MALKLLLVTTDIHSTITMTWRRARFWNPFSCRSQKASLDRFYDFHQSLDPSLKARKICKFYRTQLKISPSPMRNLPRLDKMRILVSLSNIYKIPKLSNLSFFYPIVLGDVCAECALNSRAAIFPFPVVPQRKRKPSEVGSGLRPWSSLQNSLGTTGNSQLWKFGSINIVAMDPSCSIWFARCGIVDAS